MSCRLVKQLFLPQVMNNITGNRRIHSFKLSFNNKCLLHEVEILFLDWEGFLVIPTSVSSDRNERTAMSVAFRSSKRRRRLMEAMMLLRDWPLDLVICFANFLTNIIAWALETLKGLAISSGHMLCQLFDEHHSMGSRNFKRS